MALTIGGKITVGPGITVSGQQEALALGVASSPYVEVYRWNSASGFGSKYANPVTLPTNTGWQVFWSRRNDLLAVAYYGVAVYPWSADTGFGTKYADPTGLTFLQPNCGSFTPNNDAILLGGFNNQGGPNIAAYPWTYGSGFGTKYSNPTSSANDVYHMAMSPGGEAAAFGQTNNPLAATTLQLFPWNNVTGFGTVYTHRTDSSDIILSIAFSPDNKALAYGVSPAVGGTVLRVYPCAFDTAAGVGTRYADPSGGIDRAPSGVVFSPDGKVIAVAGGSGVSAWAWDSATGFGAKYSAPSSAPNIGSTVLAVSFSQDGSAIAIGGGTSPYVAVYAWNNATGFGAKYANPSSLPSGGIKSLSFTN